MKATPPTVSHEEIAGRAYELWEARGCPPGDGLDDWNAALEQLRPAGNSENRRTRLGLRDWSARFLRKIVRRDQ